MSAARAVVVTRTPGIEDYVRHGETGVFVSPYNVEEMAAESVLHAGSPGGGNLLVGQIILARLIDHSEGESFVLR